MSKLIKKREPYPLSVYDLERACKQHGGTVSNESSGKMRVHQCESPHGKVWASSFTHCIKVEWRDGDSAERNAVVKEAITRMTDGVDVCEDEDCDYCHPE